MSIQANLQHIKSQLPVHCQLIAVTKTHPAETVQEAYAAGHRVFGENKVQEMQEKADKLPGDIQWHLIGHLQTNKVKYIAPFVTLIHAVDSLKLLQEINKQGEKNQRVIHCLLQVYIAQEETKFGLSEQELESLISQQEISNMKFVSIDGLMGMATFTENKEQIRLEFRKLKAIFEKLKKLDLPAPFQLKEISMGMSGDYEIAVEEGSTMVRVGSAIFGQRNYNNH